MKRVLRIGLLSLLCISCKKDPETPVLQRSLVKIENFVFNTKSSNNLKDHPFNIDTLNYAPYTLNGFGVFTGKSRTIKFAGGGLYQGVPVIEFSGWDDFGNTYIAKDTTGTIIELYRRKFNSTSILYALPLSVFASKKAMQGDEWNSSSGWEHGHNTLYFTLQTKVLSTNSTTTNGIGGCLEFEFSSPDFKDTVLFKPGKGPVEIRSWRAHLYENNQPGNGGYR